LKQEKQRKSAAQKRRGHVNLLKEEVDLRKLAKDALLPIQKKLQGIYSPGDGRDDGKEVSTSNLVDVLIQEARSNENLVSHISR
jgi:serine/threonine-protein kinase ATR